MCVAKTPRGDFAGIWRFRNLELLSNGGGGARLTLWPEHSKSSLLVILQQFVATPLHAEIWTPTSQNTICAPRNFVKRTTWEVFGLILCHKSLLFRVISKSWHFCSRNRFFGKDYDFEKRLGFFKVPRLRWTRPYMTIFFGFTTTSNWIRHITG